MSPCEICGNAGVVEREGKLYECECAELRRIAAAMPAYIRSAPVCEGHVKELLPDKKTRIIDAIGKSLYMSAYQNDMRAFVKLVMIKYSNKFVRITSDREIRDVYVGSTSQKARGEYSKEAVYNNIEDLVKSPDLLLIKLNELKARNKAAAGALEEAVCYRLDRNLPLWAISDRRDPFCDRSFAYSETVAAILQSLTSCRVEPILKLANLPSMESSPLAPELAPSSISPERARGIKQEVREAVSRPKPTKSRSDDDEDLGGLSSFGSGVKPGRRL